MQQFLQLKKHADDRVDELLEENNALLAVWTCNDGCCSVPDGKFQGYKEVTRLKQEEEKYNIFLREEWKSKVCSDFKAEWSVPSCVIPFCARFQVSEILLSAFQILGLTICFAIAFVFQLDESKKRYEEDLLELKKDLQNALDEERKKWENELRQLKDKLKKKKDALRNQEEEAQRIQNEAHENAERAKSQLLATLGQVMEQSGIVVKHNFDMEMTLLL